MLIEKAIESLDKESLEFENKRSILLRNFKEIKAIVDKLEELETPEDSLSMTIYPSDITIFVSGKKDLLNKIFHIFRTRGYEPSQRPTEEKQTSFFCTFRRYEQPNFCISFTSQSCRMVQIGTTTKEVPVYETVCDEEESE